MSNPDLIIDYYDNLAEHYDNNRFSNTYGEYINKQEINTLSKLLKDASGNILDLGCGTGRLSKFATVGIDGSSKMIAIAKNKFSNKNFINAPITDLPLEDNSINTIYSFHVIMHLDEATTNKVFKEIHRVLKPNGELIFDFPSKQRRNLVNYTSEGWHANRSYTINSLNLMLKSEFKYKKHFGILFLPIHRIPVRLRKFVYWLDLLLCKSFLKDFASYNLAVFIKK